MNEPGPPKGRFAAFWTSLPGILTAIATLVAIAGLLALFVVPEGDSGDDGLSRAEWADRVDPICSDATNAVRQIPPPTGDIDASAGYLRRAGRIVRDMSEKVRVIEAPTEDQGSIDRMTALWDQQADGADNIANDLQTGNYLDAQSAQEQVLNAETEADALATSLGVPACAQHPAPSAPF
jgi:hypothetical protein